MTLTRVNRNSRFGRRVTELELVFKEEMRGNMTPLKYLKLQRAAQMTALAEAARGGFMRDGSGTLTT
jgi:hypothetical protein